MSLAGKVQQKLRQARLNRLSLEVLSDRLRKRRGVVGLCYHTLSPDLNDYPYRTDAAAFGAHLAFLQDIFEILPSSAAVQVLKDKTTDQRDRPIAFICFDDGYRDNWTLATPHLELLGLPATLFAARDLIQRTTRTHLSSGELQELSAHPLWEVGAHGTTHNVLTAYHPEDRAAEMRDCAAWLADLTGGTPQAFAYPLGQVSSNVADLARQAFDHAFTTDTRTVDCFDPHQIRRYCPAQVDDHLENFARALLLAPFENGQI